jgi:hypothetical protein
VEAERTPALAARLEKGPVDRTETINILRSALESWVKAGD